MYRKLLSYFAIVLIVSSAIAINNSTYPYPQAKSEIQQTRDYYDPVVGLTGNALKTALHTLISNNTYSNYEDARVIMFQQLDNTNSVVRCVYTGQDYTIASDYSGQTSPNTEHTYAQSWFTASASVEKADLHHLFVTEMNVNSSRGNFPFGKVINATNTYASYNGYVSKKGTDIFNHTVFEPADQHKGDCARALLYFNVRYNETLTIDGVDMIPACIQWNYLDPPTTAEVSRNSLIQTTLHNRNPFVDHPEYVTSIWVGTTSNTMLNFTQSSSSVVESSGTVHLTIQPQNPNALVSTATVVLKSGNASHIGNFTPTNITFPSNSIAPQTIDIHVTDDDLEDGNETFIFEIQNVQGGYYAIPGLQKNYSLTVLDDDGVANEDQVVSAHTSSIRSIFPNPFNPETTIQYEVSKQGQVDLDIYNVKGQIVKSFSFQNHLPGLFTQIWNGKDDTGKAQGSGVYYIRMTSNHEVSVQKLVLIK
jgi:deoxyribonuclease I